MKFSNIISFANAVWWCIQTAFRPTLAAIIESPSLLLSIKRLSGTSFYHVWKIWGDGVNEARKDLKIALITPHAHGVVLDIGVGMGHTAQFLSKDKVTKYSEKAIERLVDNVLKPEGELLFCEHVAHKRSDVRFWQSVWTPIWTTVFDGCRLNRPTDVYIQRLPYWQPFPEVDAKGGRTGIWEEESDNIADEALFFHQVGRFIKREA
ncbi:hypothetical protein BU17DRAFT_77349 [Hysterangium stoloniferum]|nr:hypothetical protein BU17DRAFT_77349 [Hysterangium stoloniferum]